ncbi:P-II family nitrogen regulator, partial [Salmonella enterica]|uniref:P-II family nitrogen regulator n=1 Tax=Salmonella enterica TaxID=28901 RepID=UPI0005034417
KRPPDLDGGAEESGNPRPKDKIDVANASDQVREEIDIIRRGVRPEKLGNAKIFVGKFGRLIRIRTGKAYEEGL